MKILITGASGFLGKYVVPEALRQGYEVQALVRPQTDVTQFPWHQHPNLEWIRWDLSVKGAQLEALQKTDAVIHLAAVKMGSFQEQWQGTVVATENLLEKMAKAQVWRLIFISTFSVYDYLQLKADSLLDEQSPLEEHPENRDGYAQTKLLQENLVRQFEQNNQAKVTILRPGMIYGRESLWNAFLGVELGKNRWLKVGGQAILPITYVENCAEAILATVSSEVAIGQTINIVDDDLPTQNQYIQQLLKRTDSPPKFFPISWSAMKTISHVAEWIHQVILRGKGPLPGILTPARLYARFNPLKYSNTCARQLLNWQPRYTLEEALERSYCSRDLVGEL